jgi:transcription-repair coupling factor (superfamily II helicase)
VQQEIEKILDGLQRGQSLNATGLRASAAALLIARAAIGSSHPLWCIAPTERQAALLEQDLKLFTDLPVLLYPGYDIPPYTPLSPDSGTIAARLFALYQTATATAPLIFITPAEALLRRVPPKERLTGLAELIIRGEELDLDDLVATLTAAGYERLSLVQNVGEFSVRGGIVDLFAPGFDYPLRLDFFGEMLESIRMFDPITQRSVEEVEEAVLLPVSDSLFPPPLSPEAAELLIDFRRRGEALAWNHPDQQEILEKIASRRRFPGIEFFLPLFHSRLDAVLDFLPREAPVILLDPFGINRMLESASERIAANYQEARESGTPALPPSELFLSGPEINEALATRPQLRLYELAAPELDNGATFAVAAMPHTLIRQDIELERRKSGLLAPLAKHCERWLENGEHVLFACRSLRHAGHLAELLDQYQLPVAVLEPPFRQEHLQQHSILLFSSPLSEGFDLPAAGLHVLSENELFGERRLGLGKKGKKGKKAAKGSDLRFEELRTGDLVVHRTHGIGIYEGIVNLTLNGLPNDFLQVAYQDMDRLYLPVDRLNTVSKYQGLPDKTPKLDKLGGKSWAVTKGRVKEAVWKVAQDLLDLYARRQMEEGHAFTPPDELFHELEESFPFDETPGQMKSINEVLDDLLSDRPMDRLICGDVGFGKTEVAVRAAFKVILDNYQVAVLVPTTVLAEQHAETFRERFAGFPVRVESLNRFRTTADQKQILKDLAEGRLDLVIGTHRLLSKDVKFKRLGLLVIDEEHRFGVTHKEKIKKLRSRIDVLTLTATPIPRTLQMSLLGVRDLSLISTPPEYRRSIKTFVARHDDLVIKEAVTRELQRGGQVFLVHNRVQSIQEVAHRVQQLAPAARVAVAHGQMPGKQLEEIMVRFIRREIDVLVCTTIIESGLDIPNANTIVITRADRLGLAEIYQLRGRVGRSTEQAYAYLLVPSLDGLSKDAQQRLRALMDYHELGGGFKLAMSDLQIRGGGNILGESQSGNIAAVGYDLYLDLLQRTVEDLKRQAAMGEEVAPPEEIEPEINLRLSAYIPEHYIGDPDQRYIAYRKISGLTSPEELEDIREELLDRYGKLPSETDCLLGIMALKMMLRELKIARLEQGPSTLVFTFLERTPVAPQKILILIKQSKNRIRLTPDNKLVVQAELGTPEAMFQAARNILHALR